MAVPPDSVLLSLNELVSVEDWEMEMLDDTVCESEAEKDGDCVTEKVAVTVPETVSDNESLKLSDMVDEVV